MACSPFDLQGKEQRRFDKFSATLRVTGLVVILRITDFLAFEESTLFISQTLRKANMQQVSG